MVANKPFRQVFYVNEQYCALTELEPDPLDDAVAKAALHRGNIDALPFWRKLGLPHEVKSESFHIGT